MIRFEILGRPTAKQRPRFNGKFAYTPKETVNYENYVKMCYKEQLKDMFFDKTKALSVMIEVYYEIPKSFSKKKTEQALNYEIRPTTRPDCDNLAKGICDALNGIAWHDDSQVVELNVSKYYGEQAKVVVDIDEV